MTIQNRTVTIKGVFGKNAATTIPDPPVSGASYRDTSVTKQAIEKGWPYKNIVDSSEFNEALYEYAYISEQIEKYGFLPWCNLTDYPAGALCLGSDGVIYQAVQATGPSTTAYDPANDTNHTYWVDFVGNTYVTKTTDQTISGNKEFTGLVNLNGTVAAGSTAKQTINSWGMPDYSAAISVSNNIDTIATSNGIVYYTGGQTDRQNIEITVDGVVIMQTYGSSGYFKNCGSFLVPKGKTYKVNSTTGLTMCYFVPFVGG